MSSGTHTPTTGSLDKYGSNEYEGPKRRGCLGHLRRFWWAYVIVAIVIALVTILPLIYVGFPKIAQDQVNSATASIATIKLTNPTPNSFHVVQDGFSDSTSSFHPYLDSFNVSLSILGAASSYAMITLPGLTSDAHVPVHVDQDVQILDVQAYADYNVKVLTSESFTQRINGTTTVHQPGLPATSVSYDKTVTMKGFNLFPGFNISCLKLDNSAKPGQPNINGTVFVPNPSSIAVELGDVTYNTYVGDTYIGNTTIADFYLQPGNNSYWFTGYSDTLALLGLFKQYPDGIVPMTVKGNTSVANGQHLTYYEAALAHDIHTLNFDLKAAAATKECIKP